MAAPNSKATLTDHCLRALGYPVIEINVALLFGAAILITLYSIYIPLAFQCCDSCF
jgi:hypothetical protein